MSWFTSVCSNVGYALYGKMEIPDGPHDIHPVSLNNEVVGFIKKGRTYLGQDVARNEPHRVVILFHGTYNLISRFGFNL